MNKLYIALVGTVCLSLFSEISFAGTTKRTGQAGASELLINPWARATGWSGVNTANIKGIEAMNSNVGGLAFTKGSEAVFARTNWLGGSGITINAFGFAQKLGESGVLGVTLMSMDFGSIDVTTENAPDGGIGSYSPQFINIGVGYARSFSNSIHTGFVLRGISESATNVSAQGLTIDGGIQYVAGKKDAIKFGVALRNLGTSMSFSGDGMSRKATVNNTGVNRTVLIDGAAFDLPSLLNIGASYDIHLTDAHRFTLAGNFTSNSFTQDNIGVGAEYGYKTYFMLRAGFNNQSGLFDYATRVTSFTGASAGASVELPLGKNGNTLSIDYSYAGSWVFGGNQTFGFKLKF